MNAGVFKLIGGLVAHNQWQRYSRSTRAYNAEIGSRCCNKIFFSREINGDDLNISRRRLLMRVKNTGMKELDALLDGYMATRQNIDAKGVADFHALLDMETPSLYQMFLVKQQLPENLQGNVVAAEILTYAQGKNLTS